jgi:mannose-6-phosphate isomerase-like protein (cupin superfamily)
MQKVNTTKMAELTWSSPKGKFSGAGKEISEALGRKPESTDLNERHPFDVEILRIPPGKAPYSYHSHSAQWEFYHVISGSGVVRHKDGTTPIEAGDAFIFKPGEPHQITNDTAEDMILYVVADNPIGESAHRVATNTPLALYTWTVAGPAVAFPVESTVVFPEMITQPVKTFEVTFERPATSTYHTAVSHGDFRFLATGTCAIQFK